MKAEVELNLVRCWMIGIIYNAGRRDGIQSLDSWLNPANGLPQQNPANDHSQQYPVYGHPQQNPANGLLGNRYLLRAPVCVAGSSAQNVRSFNLLNKSIAPYRPPHLYKVCFGLYIFIQCWCRRAFDSSTSLPNYGNGYNANCILILWFKRLINWKSDVWDLVKIMCVFFQMNLISGRENKDEKNGETFGFTECPRLESAEGERRGRGKLFSLSFSMQWISFFSFYNCGFFP